MLPNELIAVDEQYMRAALREADTNISAAKETAELRRDIEQLKIEKARREEESAAKEREIEHKVGLERKRQEFERERPYEVWGGDTTNISTREGGSFLACFSAGTC